MLDCRAMKPADICQSYLSSDRLNEMIDVLSSPQIKKVLKEGGIKVKSSGGGFVTQKKKRGLWSGKIIDALNEGSDEVASEFLQQWFLNHQRDMLVDYLNALGVKHQMGETDDSFLFTKPAELVREEGAKLFERYPKDIAAIYLDYIAFQQKSNVFDDWAPLISARIDS